MSIIQTKHQQTWVKVNAQVDVGIAEVVSLLNRVSGLETLQSCQGFPGESPAYIYFHCGDWEEVCRFAFSVLAPQLPQIEEVLVRVETFAGSRPTGKLTFSAETTVRVAAALNQLVDR